MPVRLMRRLLAITISCAIAAGTTACAPQGSEAPSSESVPRQVPVTIGLAFPMGLTEETRIGEDLLDAARLAVTDANNSAEVEAAGLHFLLEPMDTKRDLETGYEVAGKLVDDERVAAVVGHITNDVALFLSSEYEDGHLPLVTLATTPLLTERGYRYIDRIAPREDVHGSAVAEFALESLGTTRAVVVTDGTLHGAAAADRFTETYADGGGTVIAQYETNAGRALTTAEQIAERSPDIVFVGSAVEVAASLSRALKQAGVEAPVAVKGSCTTAEYLELAGEAAEGDIGVRSVVDLSAHSRGRDFLAYFASAYNRTPDPSAAYSYDGVMCIVRAALDADPSRSGIAEALRAMEFEGVTGTWRFDERGDTTNLEVSLFRVVDGAWEPVH